MGDIGNNYSSLVVTVACLVVAVAGVVGVGVVGVVVLTGLFELVFPLIKCPGRELAVLQSCFDV